MLTFFRRIRRGLVDGGRTSKYLLYAMGEIALVVIGILIALQINNWNQERLNHKEEQRLLRLIYSEMGDYLWLQKIGIEAQKELVTSGERLLRVIKNPANHSNQNQIDRDLHTIYSTRWFAGAGTSTNVYDLLINGGHYGLLSSKELQKELADLKENFGYTYNYNMLQANFIDNQLSPFLNKYVDRLSLSGEELNIDSTLYDGPFRTSYIE